MCFIDVPGEVFPATQFRQATVISHFTWSMGYLRSANPRDTERQRKTNNTHDPVPLSVVGAVESENEVEDDTAQVARSAGQTGDNTVVGWMHMGDDGKVGAVTSLGKDGRYCDGANQCMNIDTGNCPDTDEDNTLNRGTYRIS